MNQSIPAIFLDRDGTINIDYGYVYKIDDFQFIEGVIEACRKLKAMGFALVLLTNQSGIAREKFTEAQFITLTKWMNWSLADNGVNLDGIYFCPHHPKSNADKYRQFCYCRKPSPGMLLRAKNELHINMAASYMAGDTIEDMQAAQAAHVTSKVLLRSGKKTTAAAIAAADWVLDSLANLPTMIKKR
ncbi:D-glycero-beta-D-manno-heptose 1,7-bisphosphate 7-phosphatase [Candidatus Fukatsuia anoeciicola]|uniref:D-glycero-beta-D-manno-heptose 1,7-bisphosphate 7-phosphatase n=1 Tax=Candidatus Fukatsuia anoeciicola TaxID=2994492 RepID=UPI003464CB95